VCIEGKKGLEITAANKERKKKGLKARRERRNGTKGDSKAT